MITIKELARLAGTSTATVSNVIHGKTNKVSPECCRQIRRLLDKYHYVEKMGLRHLNKGRSQIICFAVDRRNMYKENSILADPFYSQVFGVIEEALHDKNYYVMAYAAEDVKEIFKTVAAWNIDGIIAASLKSDYCDRLVELTGKPLVCIDTDGSPSERFINVGSENFEGGYLMTKHLLSCGCRHISIFSDSDSYSYFAERFSGYAQALREAGLQPPDKIQLLRRSREERLRQYEECLVKPADGKRGVFFLADFYAIECVSFLGQKGIAVPAHIAVAGFDDIVYAEMSSPGLTTVRQDIKQKALTALDCLFRLLDGEKLPQQDIRLPVELVVRGSA